MTHENALPKPIKKALNQLAHCRALMHEAQVRTNLQREIDDLLARGMTPAEALEHLRANPPTVDPQY